MGSKNIFVPDFVFIVQNGGLLAGRVKEGKIKIGMQAEINGKILEITNLQVGKKIQEETTIGDERSGFLFVCKGIEQDEIKEGQEIEIFKPKE